MKAKKAQGIPINVIIIAAVALLVLVILIAIFSGRINIFAKSYDDTTKSETNKVCSQRGGYCGPKGQCSLIRGLKPRGGWIDCTPEQDCCTL